MEWGFFCTDGFDIDRWVVLSEEIYILIDSNLVLCDLNRLVEFTYDAKPHEFFFVIEFAISTKQQHSLWHSLMADYEAMKPICWMNDQSISISIVHISNDQCVQIYNCIVLQYSSHCCAFVYFEQTMG